MTKSITSLTAALFVFGLALQAGAEQGKSTQVTRSNISNNKTTTTSTTDCTSTTGGTDCEDAAQVQSPRDVASGQTSGKRQAAAGGPDEDCDGLDATECQAAGVKSPRDAASGQATGKRQHKPVSVSEAKPMAPRDAASGQATGKRDMVMDVETGHAYGTNSRTGDGALSDETVSPRDAASGLPTGKRQHKPVGMAPDGDETGDDAQGMAINEKGLPGGSTKTKDKAGSAK
jgi:hypothetical protein